jgi:hypothetical protein
MGENPSPFFGGGGVTTPFPFLKASYGATGVVDKFHLLFLVVLGYALFAASS